MDTPKKDRETPEERRDEAFVISQIKQAYGIESGTTYDAVLSKVARGDVLTADERELINSLEQGRRQTKKLKNNGVKKADEGTHTKIDEIRASMKQWPESSTISKKRGIETQSTESVDLPPFLKKPQETSIEPASGFWARVKNFLGSK